MKLCPGWVHKTAVPGSAAAVLCSATVKHSETPVYILGHVQNHGQASGREMNKKCHF